MAEEIRRLFELQRAKAPEVGSASVAERKAKLKRLHDAVLQRRPEFRRALAEDLGKAIPETDLSEVYVVLSEARHAMRHLHRWVRRRVATPLNLLGTRSEVVYQPKGVALIIGPWNFPLNLTFGPLVGSIAAGNCSIVKPSEFSPSTSACMRSLIEENFDESEIAVVEGGPEVAGELIALPFDHIFFTGSGRVAKIVMKAAAEHLTPITLELGGKNPAIVDRTANLDAAALRIAWGKFLNNGQTCVAPDYVLVDSSIEEQFTAKLLAQIENIWGPASAIASNSDYGRIINESNHARLRGYLEGALAGGASVVQGGEHDAAERFFAPTVVKGTPRECDLARREIFGPVLPVDTFDTLDAAIDRINALDHPLSLYIFSGDRRNIDRVIDRTRAGDTVINDTVIHFFQNYMGFGGAGASGIGRAHGEWGFRQFSNARGVMRQLLPVSPLKLLYPPYSSFRKKIIELTMRYL